MTNEFKYGQTWNIWPSPLSLSLYSNFKCFWKKSVSWDKKEKHLIQLICDYGFTRKVINE